MNTKAALAAIEKHGILLVYPIDNRKEPLSLWSVFFPRSQMRWEWDQDGDDRVAKLWHLREELSRSGKVVYAKWFRGRATLFSKEVFTALLSVLGSSRSPWQGLSPEARQILETLAFESPLSTKQIKQAVELRGRALEPIYEKAMKELWLRLLIVGFGEVEDGAFPSLAVGATQLLFEELWLASRELAPDEARAILNSRLDPASPFLKQLAKAEKAKVLSNEPSPRS